MLHTAVVHGYKDIATLLLSRGADVNIQNDYGQSPLHFAVHNSKVSMVQLLLQNGADVNAKSERGTALDIAKNRKDTEIIVLLKKHGAKK